MAINLKAKRVSLDRAYEVYQTPDGQWTYYVLKHYRAEADEKNNPHAIVYVHAFTPATTKAGEQGDMYLDSVITGTTLIDNPRCDYVACCLDDKTSVDVVKRLNNYRYTFLRGNHPQLVNYIRVGVPKEKMRFFTRLANEYDMRIVCTNDKNYVALCLADFDNHREETK